MIACGISGPATGLIIPQATWKESIRPNGALRYLHGNSRDEARARRAMYRENPSCPLCPLCETRIDFVCFVCFVVK
jgi:hypothetical protein